MEGLLWLLTFLREMFLSNKFRACKGLLIKATQCTTAFWGSVRIFLIFTVAQNQNFANLTYNNATRYFWQNINEFSENYIHNRLIDTKHQSKQSSFTFKTTQLQSPVFSFPCIFPKWLQVRVGQKWTNFKLSTGVIFRLMKPRSTVCRKICLHVVRTRHWSN